jgi:hypothetical protein
MRDLEDTLREELARIADEAEAGAPLAMRARAGRRRRVRHLVGVAAVAAVIVVVGGAGVALRGSSTETTPSVGTPSQPAGFAPNGYRLEVWQDIGVYVPVRWGWGGAPGACGVGPTVGADGHRLSASERTDGVLPGYVGRPVGQVQRCPQGATQGSSTALPYVWLGSKEAAGSVQLAGGFVQETRQVGGTTVTVGSADADLRETILSSAHRMVASPCAGWLSSPPSVGEQPSTQAGRFIPGSMTVCAYAPAAMSGYDLLYQETLATGPAKQLVDAVDKADPMGEFSCFGASGGEWALLHLTSAVGARDYVVDLSCPSIADPSGLQHQLTSDDVLPWAVDGVNAVLHGSPLIDVPGRLIGQ